MSKTPASSSKGRRSPSSARGGPALPRCALSCAAREGHGHPIRCVAFSPHVHVADGGSSAVACFVTCGGPYATIYELDPPSGGGAVMNGRGGGGRPPLNARQVYRDVDDGEAFSACAFGGRGVGAPVNGAAPVANGDGVIYFGGDNVQHKKPQSKRSAKRRKRDERQPCVKDDASSLHAPFSLPSLQRQDGPPFLCLGGFRGVIKVIDTARRILWTTLSGHGNDITDLKTSPTDEWLLLSSSKDESIRLWNLQRGVNVAAFVGHYGHRGWVLGVAWHASGAHFASCGMDNVVKLWKVHDAEGNEDGLVERALKASHGVTADDWSDVRPQPARQSTMFATAFQQFPFFSTDQVHTNYVDCVQFIGDLILSKSVHNKVVLWKPLLTKNGNGRSTSSKHRASSSILFLREFQIDHCDNWGMCFDSSSPHHKLLALGNQKGEVKVWSVGSHDAVEGCCDPESLYHSKLATTKWFGDSKISGDQTLVRMVAFNPRGSHLVAVRDDSTVWVWSQD